jgi:hypothetical protein
MLTVSPPQTLTSVPLSWQAKQVLSAENSSAVVLSYATFSDGAAMDITGRAAVAAAGLSLPYTLGTDAVTQLPTVKVTAKVRQWQLCHCMCMPCRHHLHFTPLHFNTVA